MKKTSMITIPLVCILLSGCGDDAKQKEQELIEHTYALNLNSAATEMLVGATYSETLCNKVVAVWHDAIFDEVNIETVKYMRDKDTQEKLDFNGALKNLYEDETTISIVDKLKDNKQKVDDLMSDLASPPEKYSVCYGTISDLYKTYSSFTSVAITPTGSYNDYTANVAKLDGDFGSTYDLVKTQLPDVINMDSSE